MSVTFSGSNPTSRTTALRTDSMSDAARIAHDSYSAGKWMRKCGVVIVCQCASGPCAQAGKDRITPMKKAAALLAFVPFIALAQPPRIMLVMHGGAGTITRQSMTPETEKQYRETLEQALRTGYAVLAKGGSSL